MEVRNSPLDIIAYDFDMDEKIALNTLCHHPLLSAFIQSQKTHYVRDHMLKPLSSFQLGDIKTNFSLDEAYLKGALDAFNELLTYSYQPEHIEGE